MGDLVPFDRKRVDDVKRGEPLPQRAANPPVPSLDVSTTCAPLQSASARIKAIMSELERCQDRLRQSLEFHERCMAATELPSVAELVKARDDLVAALARQ